MSPTGREAEPRTLTAEANAVKPATRAALTARLSALKGRLAATPHVEALAFIGVGEVSDGIRLGVPVAGLAALGRRAAFSRSLANLDPTRFDTVVFARPQISPTGLREIDQARRLGKRVIVDLDDDFHSIPVDHPGYRGVGPGNPARLQALEAALAQADLVVVATPVLAERYAPLCRRLAVIPNGWSRSNPLWDQAASERQTLNIGWAGTPTHRADVALLVPDVVELLRRAPQTHLVIGGDPGVWQMFHELPETRRTFVPMVPFEMFPTVLAQFDVLLAPLSANPFNAGKSDIKLLEAGIRRIPWVASPRAAYMAWGAGGLYADTPGEWGAALARLIAEPALRERLGGEGRAQAERREATHIAERWLEALA